MTTQNSDTQNTAAEAPVKGVGTGELVRSSLPDGWHLDVGDVSSRIVRPDGKLAVYLYRKPTYEEACLLKWGYQEGHKHGNQERCDIIKRNLGLT